MLLVAWLNDPFRPTGDLDLLGFVADLHMFSLPPLNGFDKPHRWSAGGPWVRPAP